MIEDFDNFIRTLGEQRGAVARYTKATTEAEQVEAHVEGLRRTATSLQSDIKDLRSKIDSERNGVLLQHTEAIAARQAELHDLLRLIAEAKSELTALQSSVYATQGHHEALLKKVGKLQQSLPSA